MQKLLDTLVAMMIVAGVLFFMFPDECMAFIADAQKAWAWWQVLRRF